ncbi:unannotated protein [freshwater metagenome]|uniref:Unannotated protein n=1 Tax=freshwater metagenome TaxID=449393 RepID=A0A6J7EJC5_9ZZZZ
MTTGTMTAAVQHELNGLAGLRVEHDVPVPVLDSADGVLIEVQVCGVTFPDTLLLRGEYQIKPPLPLSPGFEVSGVVAQAGAQTSFSPGDRVTAFLPSAGGLAQHVVANAATTYPLADEVDFLTGAVLPINYHTAHFALALRARLVPGETVLVHGAAGGLGVACIQIAKALGADVVAVVSTDAKAQTATAAGADAVVRVDEDWVAAASALRPGGYEVVLDPVGEDRLSDSMRITAPDGRLVVLGFAGGSIPEIKVNRVMFRNVDIVGAAYGAYIEKRPEVAGQTAAAVDEFVRSGRFQPPIGHRFSLEDAVEAVALVEHRQAVGKVVVDVAG